MQLTTDILTEILGRSALLGNDGYYSKCPFCETNSGAFFVDWNNYQFNCLSCTKSGQLDELKEQLMKKFANYLLPYDYKNNDSNELEDRAKIIATKDIPIETVNRHKFIPISLSALLTENMQDVGWMVEKLIPQEGIVALSGAPGSYKTWIVYHLAICLSEEIPVFGEFKTKKAKVLLIDEENNRQLIYKRFTKLAAKNPNNIGILLQQGIKLDSSKDRQSLLQLVKNDNYDLVIFDSLVRMHSKDENDATAMARVAEALKEFTKIGATVLFTHHHRKEGIFKSNNPAQSLRGSSEISAFVDGHLAIEKKDNYLLITQAKNRMAEELRSFKVQVRDDGDETLIEYLGEEDEAQSKSEEAQEKILAYIEEHGRTARQDLQKIFKGEIGQKSIDEATRALVQAEKLKEFAGYRNKKIYALREDQTDVQQETII